MQTHVTLPILVFTLLAVLLTCGAAGQTVPAQDLVNISGYGEGAGFFRVDSIPQGADVSMDGSFRGETPVTIGVASTSPPGHTIEVQYPGYSPWSQFYAGNPSPGETILVQAFLVPLRATGAIYVTSSPPGATVSVDGSASQFAPATFFDVSAGNHVVQAAKSGFQTSSKTVNVLPGQTASVDFTLSPIAVSGSIQVASYPSGADIYVDGIFKGETGAVVGNLAPGPHAVLLRLAGYQDWTGNVDIQANQVTILSATLVPGMANTGSITISSTPSGAIILLDGNYQGFTHAGSGFEITGLDPGAYNLTLLLPGYQDYVADVRVNPDESSRVDVVLVPSPIPPGNGAVVVSSSPTGAEMYLDETFYGETPGIIRAIPPGLHNLTVTLPGYTPWSAMIQVQPGQATQVTATLTPLPVVTPTTAGTGAVMGVVAVGVVAALLAIRRFH